MAGRRSRHRDRSRADRARARARRRSPRAGRRMPGRIDLPVGAEHGEGVVLLFGTGIVRTGASDAERAARCGAAWIHESVTGRTGRGEAEGQQTRCRRSHVVAPGQGMGFRKAAGMPRRDRRAKRLASGAARRIPRAGRARPRASHARPLERQERHDGRSRRHAGLRTRAHRLAPREPRAELQHRKARVGHNRIPARRTIRLAYGVTHSLLPARKS
jgi:hypothetical protein